MLERLSVAGFCFDMDELIQRCPRLRVLEVGNGWGLGKIRVHSPTIEELVVDYPYDVCGIDIMAPVLRKFEVWTWMSLDFSVSFNAPMVENPWWDIYCNFEKMSGLMSGACAD